MIFEPDTVKGFQDFLPPESEKRTAIRKVIEETFSKYGFRPMETPIIEFDELMRGDSLNQEDEAVSDRFRLRDKGNRNLGLRFELTFQLARIFKQNPNLKLPFKRYQIGKSFRDEPTSATRFREFTQCDIDIIGSKNIQADAECLATFSDILKTLKVDSEIEINNRKLLAAIIDSVKIREAPAVMRELDKLEKVGEDTVKANLKKYADTTQILTLFKILEKPLSFFVRNMFAGAEDLENLQDLGKIYGFQTTFNPFMIRGLGYYTGNIFEVKVKDSKDTIGAGGRYDKTVGKFSGKDIPAVGISFGLERLSSLVKSGDLKIQRAKTIIISLEKDTETIKLAQKLRKSGISCITYFKKAGKALEYANSQEIPYAIFIGKEEISAKKYKLKNLDSGDEELLTEKAIISKLKK